MQTLPITRTLLALASLVVVLAGIKLAGEIAVPFLLSLFIAIICSPLIRFLTARRVPLFIAIALLFVLIASLFLFLAGLINSTVREFSASIPQYNQLLSERLGTILALAERWDIPLAISRETVLENFNPSTIMNFVSRLLLSFSGVVTNVFVLLLVVVFMLQEAPTMKHKFALIFGQGKSVGKTERYIDQVLDGVIGYLGVKTTTSMITGLAVWLMLEWCGVQFSVLWATLAFLLNYIPNIGSVIAGVPIVVQAFLLNGFSMGGVVLLGIVAINMLVGNILEPRMMGQRLGLSTLVVFLSLLFWGWLLGTVGMLLSVPLTMSLKIALESSPKTVYYALLLGDVEPDKLPEKD